MEVRILRLKLENFKGIQSMEIDMDGSDVSVYGQNATGKTTIFDAFTWCLFGKDSTDKSDFWVKPHDKYGDEIHNLETAVDVMLSIDGKIRSFRHMVAENWTKKNGEADRVYSGNTHSYLVDAVTKSAGEYAKIVNEIVNADVFRMITNPMAFNSLKWDKRREFLLKLSPVDIDKIMLAKSEYLPIKEAMEAHNTDIYGVKKVVSDERKRTYTEIEQIPIRVSEQQSMVNALGDCNAEAAREEIEEIDRKIEQIEKSLDRGDAVINQIKEKANAVAKAEAALRDAKSAAYKARSEAQSKATAACSEMVIKISEGKSKLEKTEKSIKLNIEYLEELNTGIKQLRDEWFRVDDEKMPEYNGSTVCPTCGQELPADQVESAKEMFEKEWEREKAERLDYITEKGQKFAARIKEVEEQISRDKVEADKLREEVAEEETKIKLYQEEAKSLAGEPDYSADEKICQLEAELEARAKEYQDAVNFQTPADEILIEKKRDLVARKNELTAVEANKRQLDICVSRISELENRQTELGIKVADAERFLMLIDQFVTERCGMLEESINEMFPTVRWKLFERQINGGMKDTCVCLIGGVQFSDANNAARINAGLEIISVLSKHYGVSVPVFIDNAEAVNHLEKMAAQRIALIVTANDRELRIERGIKNEEVAK